MHVVKINLYFLERIFRRYSILMEGSGRKILMSGFLNLMLFVLLIYVISRVAHHFTNTKKKLSELEQKVDEIIKRLDEKDEWRRTYDFTYIHYWRR